MGVRCLYHRRVMRGAFVQGGSLSAPTASRLRRHLQSCQSCVRQYQSMMVLDEEVLQKPRAAPAKEGGRLALRMWEQTVLQAALPVAATAEQQSSGSRLFRPMLAFAVASFAVVVSLLIFMRGPDIDQEFRARKAERSVFSVRFFCETRDVLGKKTMQEVTESPGPNEVDYCPASGKLFLALLSQREGYLYLLGVRKDGDLSWFVPSAENPAPVEVVPGNELQALEYAFSFEQREKLQHIIVVCCDTDDCQGRIEEQLADHGDPDIDMVRYRVQKPAGEKNPL